jgi:putative tricarboxylic transport membrane protein
MDAFFLLLHGFEVLLTPMNVGYMVLGILFGVLLGFLPGVGGANGIAILLPLTFSMDKTTAIIMLAAIYWGALFGGCISAILFNIPGEPWSVATTFDGHPLAKQGRAGEALTASLTSSFIGALIATLVHRVQMLEGGVPMTKLDTPVDLILTPEDRLLTRTKHSRPAKVGGGDGGF